MTRSSHRDRLRERACAACASAFERIDLMVRHGMDLPRNESLAALWKTQVGGHHDRPIDIFLAARTRVSGDGLAEEWRRLPQPWLGLSACRGEQVRLRLEVAGARLCMLAVAAVTRRERPAWLTRHVGDAEAIDLVAAQRSWCDSIEWAVPLAVEWRREFESREAASMAARSMFRHLARRLLRADLDRFDADGVEAIDARFRNSLVSRVLATEPIPASCVPSSVAVQSLFSSGHSGARHV